ncbi:hypothetical protein MMC14_003640 [Varicellaria rhodocarpa]|nr:hypothetical protein [Varicellaria rhodocarpa]
MDYQEQEPAPEPCQGYLKSFKSIIRRNEGSYASDYDYGRSSEKEQGQEFQVGGEQQVRPNRFNNNTYSPEKCDSQSFNVPCRYLNSLSQIEASSRDHGGRWDRSGYNHNCSIDPPVGSDTQNGNLDDASSSILELGLGSHPSDILQLPAASQYRPGSLPMPYASMLRLRDFEPSRSVPEGRTGSSSASISCYPAALPNQTSCFPESPNPLQIAQTLASLGGSTRQCDTRASYENDVSDNYSMINKACEAVSWPSAWNSPMYGLHLDPHSNQSFQCQTGGHQSGICDGYKIDWSSSCHNAWDDYICADDDCSSDGCSEADDCVACHDAIFPCKDECPEGPRQNARGDRLDTTIASETEQESVKFLASPEEAQNICKVRLHNDSGQLCGAFFETSKDLHLHLESTHRLILDSRKPSARIAIQKFRVRTL